MNSHDAGKVACLRGNCETILCMKHANWLRGPIGWARIVLLLLVFGGLTALIIAGIDDRTVEWQRTHYAPVPCYIEECRMTKESGRDYRNLPGWQYVPSVTYHYEVD